MISWVAVNNDPFEDPRPNQPTEDTPLGPTLTLLLDDDSPHKGNVADVVLLHRHAVAGREQRAVDSLRREIKERLPGIALHDVPWQGDDPTDHPAIFGFLKVEMPKLRRRFAGRELVVHISPGTPAMQTIWVLMGEAGFIEQPFLLVKSLRKGERRGRRAVVPVQLDLETFYKAYRAARPRRVASGEQRILWDPAQFQTERMRRLFSEARRYSTLNVPVLLLGERGTGKTTLASWIRLHSPFRREEQDAHWPAVACGQYSPETMRAELFGHRKGAFTGATQNKKGLISAADGDTLFLDEVADVSRDLQRLLIKAIEEKEYVPLGALKPIRSDFRLLTATNIEAPELRNRLDADFLDRISLVELRLPPLREIRTELSWLWPATFEEAVRRSGVDESVVALAADSHEGVVTALARHALPGNLRDLLKLAYRLVAALADPHEPMVPRDAVHYALDGMDGSRSDRLVSTAVVRAFADHLTLDEIFDHCGGCLPTKEVEGDLRSYMGTELRRIAAVRRLDGDSVADVSERTLRNWLSQK